MNLVHASRSDSEPVSFCGTTTGSASTALDEVTCDECLYHVICEDLEGTGEELHALYAARRLASLVNPDRVITVTVGPKS